MAKPPAELLYLKQQWREITAKQKAATQIRNELFEELLTLYTLPGRHYHNLKHIADIIELVHQYKNLIQNNDSVLFAAFYHDAVYDTHSTTNEEESALLAKKSLQRLDVDNELINYIYQYILSTKKHDPQINHTDCSLFLDFDLHTLSVPANEYKIYTKQIRAEYQWVSENVYVKKRCNVLKNFLERKFIYHTPQLRGEWEENARSNIRNEISSLEKTNY